MAWTITSTLRRIPRRMTSPDPARNKQKQPKHDFHSSPGCRWGSKSETNGFNFDLSIRLSISKWKVRKLEGKLCDWSFSSKFYTRFESFSIAFSPTPHKIEMKNLLPASCTKISIFLIFLLPHRRFCRARTRHYFNVFIIRLDYTRNISRKCFLNTAQLDFLFI